MLRQTYGAMRTERKFNHELNVERANIQIAANTIHRKFRKIKSFNCVLHLLSRIRFSVCSEYVCDCLPHATRSSDHIAAIFNILLIRKVSSGTQTNPSDIILVIKCLQRQLLLLLFLTQAHTQCCSRCAVRPPNWKLFFS